jgi:hypothetical protein
MADREYGLRIVLDFMWIISVQKALRPRVTIPGGSPVYGLYISSNVCKESESHHIQCFA